MLVSAGMVVALAQYMTSGIEWGHVIRVCLGSYLSVRGSGRRRGLKWFVKNVVTALHSAD